MFDKNPATKSAINLSMNIKYDIHESPLTKATCMSKMYNKLLSDVNHKNYASYVQLYISFELASNNVMWPSK